MIIVSVDNFFSSMDYLTNCNKVIWDALFTKLFFQDFLRFFTLLTKLFIRGYLMEILDVNAFCMGYF